MQSPPSSQAHQLECTSIMHTDHAVFGAIVALFRKTLELDHIQSKSMYLQPGQLHARMQA
jgi:hypothetical protein